MKQVENLMVIIFLFRVVIMHVEVDLKIYNSWLCVIL